MADETSMALEELLRKAQLSEAVDCLREGVRALAQALMEAEVSPHVGARRDERTSERTGERKGSRERRWDTRVGSLTRRVPRVRDGSSFCQFTAESAPLHHGEPAPARYGQTAPRGVGQQWQVVFPGEAYAVAIAGVWVSSFPSREALGEVPCDARR